MISFRKFFLLSIVIFSFVALINQSYAIFHDENWQYYFQNTETHELRYFNVEWDMWDGWFPEIYHRTIDIHKIPVKNFFDHWDLVGYRYQWRGRNYQCKWDTGRTKLEVLTDYGVENADGNPCRNLPMTGWKMTPRDLGVQDRMSFYWDILLSVLPLSFMSILVKSIAMIPIAMYSCRWIRRISYPLCVIYASLSIAILYELCALYFGFSKLEILGDLFGFWAMGMFEILLIPLFIWGAIVFSKWTPAFHLRYLTDRANRLLSFLLKFGIFFTIFYIEGDLYDASLFWVRYALSYLIIFLLLLSLVFHKRISIFLQSFQIGTIPS